jgi:aspartate/methionine/tyrosine aminotransferase
MSRNPSTAALLNSRLASAHPAAAVCLSGLGRRLFYPRGVPAQAREAKHTRINATIGQLTDGHGGAMPLPAMWPPALANSGELTAEEVFLYAAQGGNPELRNAWDAYLRSKAGGTPSPMSLPMVTCGLTHGLSTVADMFVDPGTQVLVPSPGWGNYQAIFGIRRGARMVPYKVMNGGVFDPAGLAHALANLTGPAVLVLNLPSNPIGYTPTIEQGARLVDTIHAHPHPLVVVCDDAYLGMLWEDGLVPHSLFHDLAKGSPEHILAVKVDGATKELFFFGGRVGFLTFGTEAAASEVLEEKAKAISRATISSTPAPSQALVLKALLDPELPVQRAAILGDLQRRYHALKAALSAAGLAHWPFNSAFFALVDAHGEPEALRRTLLGDGVGVVSVPEAGAIRIVYGSTPLDQLGELVEAIARRLQS